MANIMRASHSFETMIMSVAALPLFQAVGTAEATPHMMLLLTNQNDVVNMRSMMPSQHRVFQLDQDMLW